MEGAFRVWLRGSQVTYFTLKGQARPKRPKHSNHNIDDLSQIKIWTHGEVRTCTTTLAKTEKIYPKNVGALVVMNFT